jgi:hypothetical protein
MLQIPDSLIVSYSKSPQEYKEGMKYYRTGRIQSVRILEDRPVFYAVVRGDEDYRVRVVFDENGLYQSAECTCSSTKSWGHCKHIVAVLIHVKRLKEKGTLSEIATRRNSRQIFRYFEQVPVVQKQEVILEPVFEFQPANKLLYGTSSLLSLRVGLDRMYVVRHIGRFLEQLENSETIEFGRYFTYDPYWHEIPYHEGTILGFLKEIHDVNQMSGALNGTRNNGLFRDKFICLSDTLIKRFFSIMGDKTFKAIISDGDITEVQVRKERIPASFLAQTEADSLVFEIQTQGIAYPITTDNSYILAGGQIYAPPKDQVRSLSPFLQLMNQSESSKLVFYGKDKERFVSEVLPYARQAGDVSISDDLAQLLLNEPLHSEIYFDRDGGGIQARVQFHYGESVVDPFDPGHRERPADVRILVRDTESERKILELMTS